MILTDLRIKITPFLLTLFFFCTLFTCSLFAQNSDIVFNYRSSMFAGPSKELPFWLHANKLGKVDPKSTNFINELDFRSSLLKLQDFSLKGGGNLVARASQDESMYFSELYVSASLSTFQLDIGRFAQPIGLNNHELSVGSMMVSYNATPLNKISFSTSDFLDVPFANGTLQYKGMLSHGYFSGERYIQDPYLHQKYFYLRFNIGDFSGTGGIIHNTVWAGSREDGKLPQSFKDYLRVIAGMGSPDNSDAPGMEKSNVLGNSVAAYEFEALYRFNNFSLSLTRMFYLEDKVSTRFRSPWDGMWGINFRLADSESMIEGITYEHINTIQQDAKEDEIVGRAHYYYNSLYRSGWTHEHRVLGTPLIIYNEGLNRIVNSVLIGHHLGFKGQLISRFAYRVLATYTRNYGIREDWIQNNMVTPRGEFRSDQYSFLIDFQYEPEGGKGLGINFSIGSDMGGLYDENLGIMLGVSWNKFLSY